MILYDSQLLIDFYIKNGLEFDTKRNYFGTNIKSYVLKDNENIIAAISFSEYKKVNYIEAIAVDKKYRKNGYAKLLLDKVIDEVKKPLYIISKNDNYFLNYGFKYDNTDLIDKECKTCNKYNISCFPKVMVCNKFKFGGNNGKYSNKKSLN